MLGVERKVESLRWIGGPRLMLPSEVDGLEHNELSPLSLGERDRGMMIEEAHEDDASSGVRGVDGQPLIWSQQSSQTRDLRMGEEGDSNADNGTFRGGCKKDRLEVSNRSVTRPAHVLQYTPPHLRQCYRRREVRS